MWQEFAGPIFDKGVLTVSEVLELYWFAFLNFAGDGERFLLMDFQWNYTSLGLFRSRRAKPVKRIAHIIADPKT